MPQAIQSTAVNKVSLARDGDTEIWAVRGTLEDGFNWSLPVLARPYRQPEGARWYFVPTAGSYTASQYNELCPILDAWDHCPDDQAGWWFREDTMPRFSAKHPGMTPEAVLAWPGYVAPKLDEERDSVDCTIEEGEPGFSSAELAFIKRVYYLISGDVSYEALKIIFLAIKKEAISALTVERRVLDLGFIRLAYVPMRVNWKEALCVRFGGLLGMFRKPPQERHEAMEEAGVYPALASVKLLAIDRRHHFAHWTLEVLQGPDLERAMEEQEYARAQKLGPAAYAHSLLAAMSKRFKLTLDILKRYAEAVSIPPGRKKEASQFGTTKVLPALDQGCVRPGKGLCESLNLSPEDAFKDFSDEALEPPDPRTETPDPIPLPKFLRPIPSFRKMIGNGVIIDTPSEPARNGRHKKLKEDGGIVIKNPFLLK